MSGSKAPAPQAGWRPLMVDSGSQAFGPSCGSAAADVEDRDVDGRSVLTFAPQLVASPHGRTTIEPASLSRPARPFAAQHAVRGAMATPWHLLSHVACRRPAAGSKTRRPRQAASTAGSGPGRRSPISARCLCRSAHSRSSTISTTPCPWVRGAAATLHACRSIAERLALGDD